MQTSSPITAEDVFERMKKAIDRIDQSAASFPWSNPEAYACWMAQTYYYVRWTTRQLALASASVSFEHDEYHWRFIEELREEFAHEKVVLQDLKSMGRSPYEFEELPHTAFFYQTLTYQITKEDPFSIVGYSLTLEGFAAEKADKLYPAISSAHGTQCTRFLKLHCEVDKEHFANALGFLSKCPKSSLKQIYRSIGFCESIYVGILQDIKAVLEKQTPELNFNHHHQSSQTLTN